MTEVDSKHLLPFMLPWYTPWPSPISVTRSKSPDENCGLLFIVLPGNACSRGLSQGMKYQYICISIQVLKCGMSSHISRSLKIALHIPSQVLDLPGVCSMDIWGFFDKKSILFCHGCVFCPFLQYIPSPCKLHMQDTRGTTDFSFSLSVIDTDTKIPWSRQQESLREAVLCLEPQDGIHGLLFKSDINLLMSTPELERAPEEELNCSTRAVVGRNR